jgi:prevent-host-death family protein
VVTMEQIGIRELRDNLTATIRRVRAGETIEITNHRERVAVLAPARVDRFEQLYDASDITPGRALERPLRRYPAVGEMTASQALEEDRAER